MTGIITSLQPHIIANKKKTRNYASKLEVLEKYLDKAYYKRFYQIDKIISFNKFF